MPTIVALPGTLCPPEVFAPTQRALADQLPVEPFSWLTTAGPWDIPTLADVVAGHIRDRHDGPVIVCGHSTGGAIALQLALTAPDLVSGLLLVNTGPNMREHGDVGQILAAVRDGWGPALHAGVLDRSFHTPLDPVVRARMLSWSAAVLPQAVLEVLTSQRDLDLAGRLDEIDIPAVVVHGIHDPVRSADRAAEFAAALPRGRLQLVGSGHTPVYETPAAVADAARTLLH